MNKAIKSIVLAFVLFSPAAVYLFLQGFGQNEFDIPVFYENGLDTLTSCGQVMYPASYQVDLVDSIKGSALLFDFGVLSDAKQRSAKNNVISYLSKYEKEDRIKTLSLYTGDTLSSAIQGYPNLQYIGLDEGSFTTFAQCQLLANPNDESGLYPLVLVDDEWRIRGYYDATELEEIDRLNTEVYILLNE